VQVEPMKPELNAPGTNLSTLKSDEPLSTFAFKFNLRPYHEGWYNVREETFVTENDAALSNYIDTVSGRAFPFSLTYARSRLDHLW